MKKLSFTVIIVGLIVFLFFFPILWYIGFLIWDPGCFFYDCSYMKISFKNAPENTAYVDLLIKIDADDPRLAPYDLSPKVYRARKKDNGHGYDYEPMNIDENSEIALLNDDGYVSFIMHGFGGYDITVYEDGRIILSSAGGFYGDFKAAYVDENGNVLKITEPAKQKYNGREFYTLSANGDRAVFANSCRPEWAEMTVYFGAYIIEGAAFLALIVFIVLAIVAAVRRKLERSKL